MSASIPAEDPPARGFRWARIDRKGRCQVAGRGLIPPRRGGGDDRDESGDRLRMPVPPATVAATHLAASAVSLVDATDPKRSGIDDLGELADILDRLLAAQRHVTDALGNIATRVDARLAYALTDRPGNDVNEDVTALVEVLLAASAAAEHTAGALGHATPIVTALVESTGRDTRL